MIKLKIKDHIWRKGIPILLLLVVALPASAQVEVKVSSASQSTEWFEEEWGFKADYADTDQMEKGLEELIQQLHEAAYLEASVDDLIQLDSLHYNAEIHVGKQYQWLQLGLGNVPREWANKAGFRSRLYENKPFSLPQFLSLKEKLLLEAENNGYPFAEISLQNLTLRNGAFAADLLVEKDSLVLIQEINTQGEVKLSNYYLQNYLGIKEGTPYDQSKILRIKDRLKELPFLDAGKDPTVTFLGNRARVNVPLQKRRSSKFDFIIGVLPNSTGNTETRQLQITGTFKGELYNQFGQGERIYASFERLRPETQQLDLQFNYPYLLNFPFGTDVNFNLYKRDSTYLDVLFDFGIQYLLEGGNYIKAFWNNQSSRLLSINEQRIQSRKELPRDLDYNQSSFGLAILKEKLDYRYNPRRGWSFFFRGSAGIKKILPNQDIEALELNLYDTLTLRTFQYQLDLILAAYLPLFQRSTLKLGAVAGGIFAETPIYRNEQYRIGGNRLMRGYDEESLFVTRYGIFTAEYRFLIGQNSYLYAFGDFGYTQNVTTTSDEEDQPIGFGAGITFETQVGVFGLSLAFGRQQGAFDFGAPKVHFGYVSLF